MRISEKTGKNHKRLFVNHLSTLKETDPELVEIFDNFAFDEVFSHGNIDFRTLLMMISGSMIASRAFSEYKIMLGAALNVGVTPVEIKEIGYQAVPCVGMAVVFDFIHVTNEILVQRGIQPLEGQSITTPQPRLHKGLKIQKSIFGETIDKMHNESPENQVHIQKYLSVVSL